MDNQLQIFENEEFGKVRVIEIDGEPWFVGNEVAAILKYSNARDALARHVDHDDKGVVKHDTLGGTQKLTVINESGLYALIFGSKLPAARDFKRWVTSEILPSLRKHGAYITDAVLDEVMKSQDFAFELFKKLQSEKGKTAALLDKVQTLAPKATYCDQILKCTGALQVSIIARDYGMTAVAFNRLLHKIGIQFRVGSTWVLYKRFADQGYTKSNTYCTPSGTGVVHTLWTQKGRMFLYNTLCTVGVVPLMEVCEEYDFFEYDDEEAYS